MPRNISAISSVMLLMRCRVPICCARPGSVTSTALASIFAASSAEASSDLRDSSAPSTAARTSLAVLPTAARSSFGMLPIERRYPVSVPDLPSTPMRTCSSAAESAACAMAASVSARSVPSSSVSAMFLPSVFASPPAACAMFGAIKKEPIRPCIQGRDKTLAVPPRLTRTRRARCAAKQSRPLVCPVTGAPGETYWRRTIRPFNPAAGKGNHRACRRALSADEALLW